MNALAGRNLTSPPERSSPLSRWNEVHLELLASLRMQKGAHSPMCRQALELLQRIASCLITIRLRDETLALRNSSRVGRYPSESAHGHVAATVAWLMQIARIDEFRHVPAVADREQAQRQARRHRDDHHRIVRQAGA